MFWIIFTNKFRTRLKWLAQNAAGHEARILAAKVSPLISAFCAILALQCYPDYGYDVFALVLLVSVAVGAGVAFSFPVPFIMLLRITTVDPNEVVLWRKKKADSHDEA